MTIVKSEIRFHRPALRAVAVLLMSGALSAQGVVAITSPITLTTGGGSQLAPMLMHIQHLYSTAINFEEVPLEHQSDLSKVQIPDRPGVYFYVDRSGSFSVQLDSYGKTAYQAVLTVLAAYSSSGLPGVYQAIDEGSRVDVIPMQTRGTDGQFRRVTPVMDAPVSFAHKERARPITSTYNRFPCPFLPLL